MPAQPPLPPPLPAEYAPAEWLTPALAALTPPDTGPAWRWLEEHFYVMTGPMAGQRWQSAHAPWARRILEAAQDPLVRMLVAQAAAQSAKTETMLGMGCRDIVEDPGPAMWVTIAKADADDFVLERMWPAFDACEPVARLYPVGKAARQRKKTHSVHFPGGVFEVGWARSKGKLQSRTRRYLYLDEVRNWPNGALGMVLKRSRRYEWASRTSIISCPGKVGDTMDTEYRAGTQEHYHVECPHCRKRVADLLWRFKKGDKLGPPHAPFIAVCDGGIVYDTNEETCPGGQYDFEKLYETIRYVWPCCGGISRDTATERYRIAENGTWVPYNPKAPRDRVSLTWSAMLPPWVSWAKVVEEFLLAMDMLKRGDPTKFIEWVNETRGEPWRDEYRNINRAKALHEARADYDVTAPWPDELVRVLTADVQRAGARYRWLVRAFGKPGRGSRLVAWGTAETREEIDALAKEWGVPAANIGFDTGYDTKTENGVYSMLLESGYSELTGTLWKGLKGDKAENFLTDGGVRQPWRFSDWFDPFQGTNKAGTANFIRTLQFSKSHLLDRLVFCQKQVGGPHLIPDKTPAGMPDIEEYIAQATAYEVVEETDKRGETTGRWHRIHKADHWTSCEMMALVMAMAMGVFAAQPPPAPPPGAQGKGNAEQEPEEPAPRAGRGEPGIYEDEDEEEG